jgi:hypothetical protein
MHWQVRLVLPHEPVVHWLSWMQAPFSATDASITHRPSSGSPLHWARAMH